LEVSNWSGTGVVYQTGGTFSSPYLWIGGATNGRAEYNQNGGLALIANSVLLNNGSSGTNYLNLNGGTLATCRIFENATGGVNVVNFNGGTLLSLAGVNGHATNMATIAGVLGYNASGTTGAVDAAYIWSGGAIIDTSNSYINIMENLLAPPGGNGVTNITVSGASGYLGAPYVAFAGGGGSNATAMAQLDGGGNVTNILITSPGSGYTGSPTISLLGGGGASGALTSQLGVNVGGGLTKLGTGLLVLGGTNTYPGGTLIANGTLAVTNDFALGAAGGGLTLTNGGIFEASGNLTLNGRTITLQAGGGGLNVDPGVTLLQTNLITGAGGLTKLGVGTLALAGLNTYIGGTTISNGTVKLGNNNALPVTTALYVDTRGTFDLAGWSQQVNGMDGSQGVVTDSVGGGLLTMNFTGSQNFLGTLTGPGNLTLAGGGTLILTGTNSFSGATTVTNGSTYVVNGLHNGGVITVYSGSRVQGSGLISQLQINGGTYAPGNSIATQVVSSLTLTNAGLLEIELGNNAHDLLIVTNSLSMAAGGQLKLNLAAYSLSVGAKLTILDWTTAAGFSPTDAAQWFTLNDVGANNGVVWTNGVTLTVDGGTGASNLFTINYDDLANGVAGTHAITLTTVPEPGTASLLGLAGVVFLFRRLRTRKPARD
jgi:autotransporter-associated beta strand protein